MRDIFALRGRLTFTGMLVTSFQFMDVLLQLLRPNQPDVKRATLMSDDAPAVCPQLLKGLVQATFCVI
jgi:hypothetical protein